MLRLVIIILLVLLTGCGPQATPFPADIPSVATSTPVAGAQASVRYALAPNTQGLVSDLSIIQADAQIEQLTEPINPADLGSRYDIVVAYGDLPGGARSPITPHTALVIKTDSYPLNNPILMDAFRKSIQPQLLVTVLNIPGAIPDSIDSGEPLSLRTELANAGWPDGFSLNLAYAYVPGIQEWVQQFRAAGIRIQPTLMSKPDIMTAFDLNRVQAALITWGTSEDRGGWTARFGDDHVFDLYTMPISYRVVSGLNITFTSDGWPLASR